MDPSPIDGADTFTLLDPLLQQIASVNHSLNEAMDYSSTYRMQCKLYFLHAIHGEKYQSMNGRHSQEHGTRILAILQCMRHGSSEDLA